MEMKKIEGSSMIVAIGYDPEARVLRVEFKKGVQWDYFGVLPEAYLALRYAKSTGSHFHAFIKNHYDAKKVEAPVSDADH